MDDLRHDYSQLLLARHEPPCLSLYQPTERAFPHSRQNQVRFRNLLRELEQSLARQYPGRETAPILRPLADLAGDRAFWRHPRDGLAVFATRDLFRAYWLRRPVRALAIVAESFHTKPLVRMMQSWDGYRVLALSRSEARLFEGDRYALDELALPEGFPARISDVVEPREGRPERAGRAYGPIGPGSTHHGTDQRQQQMDTETARFFRAVDEAVQTQLPGPAGLPLLLAALPEHQPLFRDLSRNPALLAGGIDANPDTLSAGQLRESAWALMLPQYEARLDGILEQFGAARAAGRGSADPADIARGAAGGRVATLLVESDREVPGRLDPATGAIAFGRLGDPDVDDLLDDIGEQVLRSGGEVLAVPAERMPAASGIAAIYRH